MRGNILKGCVGGVLAFAALTFAGCTSEPRGSVEAARQENSDTLILEDSQAGTGGSGNANTMMGSSKKGGAHTTHSMAGDGGTSGPTDAGTGGSGFEPSALPNNTPGTAGDGVTGSQSGQLNEPGGHSGSGGVPAP
ncbi:MAG: hypothetical protein ABW123_27145 [Cystobacter sp.]